MQIALGKPMASVRDLGIHALVLHALDKRAKQWSLGLEFGFETLLDDPLHLCLSVGNAWQRGIRE